MALSQGRRRGSVFLALVLAVLLGGGARGQAQLVTRVLDSSTVIRLHFAHGGSGQGSLLTPFGPTSTALVYCSVLSSRCPPAQGVLVPRDAISRLDVQRGTRAGRGFLIGTAIAGVVVVPFFVIVGSLSEGETRGGLIAKGVLVSVVVGGGLGALIGHTDPKWVPAP